MGNLRVLFGLVGFLWHINYCRLSNAKSSLHMHIGYMIRKQILLLTFLNETKLILFTQLNDFKYCYITFRNKHQSFVCTRSL